jgi:SH3 domain-containing protein
MKRVVVLLLVAAGLIYVAKSSLFSPDAELSGSATALSEAESAEATGETPWTGIDSAVQNSPHAILPEKDPPPASPTQSSPSQSDEKSEDAKKPQSTGDAVPPAGAPPELVMVTTPASIREGPSPAAAILGVAQPGAEAQVISRQAEWLQIIDPRSKKIGWVEASFLTPQSAPATTALSREEIDAALDSAGDAGSASQGDESSLGPRTSHKHASSHRHRRHGLALRFFFRRLW